MAKQNRPDRWEANLMAALMAVAGAPFLFDRLAALVHSGVLTLSLVLRAAPILAIVAGAIILLTDANGISSDSGQQSARGNQHEL